MAHLSVSAQREESLGWAMFALGIAVNLALMACLLAAASDIRFEFIEIRNIHAADMQEQFLPGIVYMLNAGLVVPLLMLYGCRLSDGGERLFAAAGISYLIGQFGHLLFVYTYWLTMGSTDLSAFRGPLHVLYVFSFAAFLALLGYCSMVVDIVRDIEKRLIQWFYAVMDGLVGVQW